MRMAMKNFPMEKLLAQGWLFFHYDLKHMIRLHRPHPSNQLKEYQVNIY